MPSEIIMLQNMVEHLELALNLEVYFKVQVFIHTVLKIGFE